MVFDGEDNKARIEKFRGLYSRSLFLDEVPLDHAADCLNVDFTSDSGFTTRSGSSRLMQVPWVGIKRFFGVAQDTTNLNEPFPTNASSFPNSLMMDYSGGIHVGNNGGTIYQSGAVNDFCAVNMGNRTYISPFNGAGGVQGGLLQLYDAVQNTCRNAAGLAPAMATAMTAVTNSAPGNVAAGVHKVAVVYETDTGFWTQPGPKRQIACSATAGATPHSPTTLTTVVDHGMATGESHTLRSFAGGGTWANLNGTYYVTVIDSRTFTIPVNSNSFGGGASGQIDAGFLPAVVTNVDNAHSILVSNIPIGPSFVKKRIILATRADEEEFFFVPFVVADGTTTPPTVGSYSVIPDNLTTSVFINFSDTDLVDSADYLFDIMEAIPGGSALCKYRGRLCIAGSFLIGGVRDRVLLSNIDDPETFNWVSGYLQVQTESDRNPPASLFVLRDTLYVSKFTGTFAFEDNGNNPSTWPITVVDSAIGGYSYGLANWTISQPTSADTGDIVLIASKVGLILFDGVMRRPELSYKIQSLWRRMNFSFFHRVQIAHDPWLHRLYIIAPLDNAADPNVLITMDYVDGRTPDLVRWSIYRFPFGTPSCVGMYYTGGLSPLPLYTLLFAFANSSYMFYLDSSNQYDDVNPISSYYQTGLVSNSGVSFWKMLTLRAVSQHSASSVAIQLSNQDATQTANPAALQLTQLVGKELQRQFNFQAEKVSIKLTSSDFSVQRIDVWGQKIWDVRPA